jgi:hypothetical protein
MNSPFLPLAPKREHFGPSKKENSHEPSVFALRRASESTPDIKKGEFT